MYRVTFTFSAMKVDCLIPVPFPCWNWSEQVVIIYYRLLGSNNSPCTIEHRLVTKNLISWKQVQHEKTLIHVFLTSACTWLGHIGGACRVESDATDSSILFDTQYQHTGAYQSKLYCFSIWSPERWSSIQKVNSSAGISKS